MKPMTTKTANGGEEQTIHQRNPSAVAKRVHRALDSFFYVEAVEPGKYRVYSGSGEVYTVNLPAGTCTCPDGQRGPWCKHAYRAAFKTGEIPDIDGVHVEADDTDGEAEPTDEDDERDTLTARVERFDANNSGASAIEVISQLGISPDQKERVEEILT